MFEKLYSSEEREMVFDWIDRWLALIKFINETTGTDDPSLSPPVPSDLKEIYFWQLCCWFIAHQARFVPLWADFSGCQDWASHEGVDAIDTDDLPGIDKYFENPFFFFYEPENLYKLAWQLGLQNGTDIWEPSEDRAGMAKTLMIGLGKRMIEFIDWMDERVCDYR